MGMGWDGINRDGVHHGTCEVVDTSPVIKLAESSVGCKSLSHKAIDGRMGLKRGEASNLFL